METRCLPWTPGFYCKKETRFRNQKPGFEIPERMLAMNPDLRRRTDDLCARLAQLRDSL